MSSDKMNNNLNLCGSNIKRLRSIMKTDNGVGISHKELSERLSDYGIYLNESEIINIELGKRQVFDVEILAFTKVFNVSVYELLEA